MSEQVKHTSGPNPARELAKALEFCIPIMARMYGPSQENAPALMTARAALEAWRAQHVCEKPVGWVMVPKEPTEKMLNEGSCAVTLPGPRYIEVSAARDCWKYMIAAVPQPPGEAA